MSEEEVKHLFDTLWKTDNAVNNRINPLGNGLGLSICKMICESLGGGISVNSKLG